MTPAELESLARNKFNAANDSFFSSAELHSYIYVAALEASMELDCIESYATDTSVDGTRGYNFPTRAYKIKTVLYDDEVLTKLTLKEAEDLDIWDATDEGTPDSFYEWNNTIYLDPIPSTSALTIGIYYYAYHPDVLVGSASLSLPVPIHPRLINKILADMYGKDQNTQMADYYLNLWENVDKPAMRKFNVISRRGNKFTGVRMVE
jgi:hypothetical protein